MMTDIQATPASEWRKPREEGYLVKLPSGNLARLGAVDLSSLLIQGEIPDLLTPLVTKMLFDDIDQDALDAQFSADNLLERGGEALSFINTICKASFIEPRIVDGEPGEGEIVIEDVDVGDRSFVMSICIYGARVLRSFRVGQKEDVESVRDGEDDEREAEQPPGD